MLISTIAKTLKAEYVFFAHPRGVIALQRLQTLFVKTNGIKQMLEGVQSSTLSNRTSESNATEKSAFTIVIKRWMLLAREATSVS